MGAHVNIWLSDCDTVIWREVVGLAVASAISGSNGRGRTYGRRGHDGPFRVERSLPSHDFTKN